MLTVKVFANPREMDKREGVWIEMEFIHGNPVHPSKFKERIMKFLPLKTEITGLKYLCTVNGDAIAALGSLVRSKQISLPVQVIVVHKDGTESEPNPMDVRGDLVKPWAEKEEDCDGYNILEAGFHFRYEK